MEWNLWKTEQQWPNTLTVYGEHIKKQERTMADCKIQPVLSRFKLVLGSTLVSPKLTERKLDKSYAICKLCHTKLKSRCIAIASNRWVPRDSHPQSKVCPKVCANPCTDFKIFYQLRKFNCTPCNSCFGIFQVQAQLWNELINYTWINVSTIQEGCINYRFIFNPR